MKLRATDDLTFRTPTGAIQFKSGEIFDTPSAKPFFKLIESGKIEVVESAVFRIWSELLQDHILVCPSDDMAKSMRAKGGADVVYSMRELKELYKVVDVEGIREIHKAKKIFEQGMIVETKGGRK
jgi:hypothetical protein